MIFKCLISLMLFIAVAGAVPIANEYSGIVYLNGAVAPSGTNVTASVDNIRLPYNSTVNLAGRYNLQVTGEEGQTVRFYINENLADQTDSVSKNVNDTFDPYIKKVLDLSAGISRTATGGIGGSGGGGSGGGGAPSDEDFKNIERQESRDVDVHKGQVSYRFTTQDVLEEIGFDAMVSEGLVTAKLELLKGRPKKSTSDAPGTVYRYFNIVVGTSGYGSSSKLENAYAIFNVPDAWLNDNGLDSVKLMKLKDGTWIDLKTEKIGAGAYKAYTLGFSGFAIVGISSAPDRAPIAVEAASAPSAMDKPVKSERTTMTMVNFILVISLITGIVIAFLFNLKKKR